jgi:hypothetical protein
MIDYIVYLTFGIKKREAQRSEILSCPIYDLSLKLLL